MVLTKFLLKMLIPSDIYRTKLSSTFKRVKANSASCLSASTILSEEEGILFTKSSTG